MRYIPQIIIGWVISFQMAFATVETYQIKKGQTLLKIAEQLQAQFESENITDQQIAWALYKNNPQAFQTCNLFALKVGAMLKVPQEHTIIALNPQQADLEIKRQQQQWKTAKGKIKNIICSKPTLPKELETLELKESPLTPISPSLLTIPISRPKPIKSDFYSIDLIDNLQDLPSLELMPTTPLKIELAPAQHWQWWHILVTLSGFVWGCWLFFKNRQLVENKENIKESPPQVLENAILDTDNLISKFNVVPQQSEELLKEPLYEITPASFEKLLEEAFQTWHTPTNTLLISNVEELLSKEELERWATNEPTIDRQVLDKFFN